MVVLYIWLFIKSKALWKDKSLIRKRPNAIWEEFLCLCIHGQGAPYRMIWQWGHRTCTPANKLKWDNKIPTGSPEGISSSPWLLGWLEGPSGVSPVVQEAILTYAHLLPAYHVSALIELPPSSRKGPFHDLIQPGWWYLKTISSCGCLPFLS